MNTFELIKSDAFSSFVNLAHAAGFSKVYKDWYFEDSTGPSDGWATNSMIIDGIPIKFFMFRDDAISSGSFIPSIIVNVDEIIDAHPDIDWGDNEIDPDLLHADMAWKANLNFKSDVNHLSVEEISETIQKVVDRAKVVMNSRGLN